MNCAPSSARSLPNGNCRMISSSWMNCPIPRSGNYQRWSCERSLALGSGNKRTVRPFHMPWPRSDMWKDRRFSCSLLFFKRFASELASVSAASCGLLACHRLIMVVNLRLAEQVVVDCDFPNRTFKPCVQSHGSDIQRTVGHRWRYLYPACGSLTHTAGEPVSGLVPLHPVDPDVDGARKTIGLRTN